MTKFNGIPIYEDRLLWRFCFVTILILGAVVFTIVLLYKLELSDYIVDTSKQKRRLRKLKNASHRSAFAYRKYEQALKIYNQNNPKTPLLKKIPKVDKIILAITSLFLIGLLTIYFSIFFPMIIDYSNKDYGIYEGTYTQIYKGRTTCIILDDGRKLEGRTEGDYDVEIDGKLVYSKRSGIVIGWQND